MKASQSLNERQQFSDVIMKEFIILNYIRLFARVERGGYGNIR